MGGKALSKESSRLPAAEYYALEMRMVECVRGLLPGRRVAPILAYQSKPDFGDIDIIVSGGEGYDPLAVARGMEATELVRNGDVTSVGVLVKGEVFQVDLIKVTRESFDFAYRYFSFNDLGNLLGRVAHKFGAKLGHTGLLCPLRDPENSDHLICELEITRDFGKALELLGYDTGTYEAALSGEGFWGLEDVFQYVVTSPFVSRAMYLLDNRNHAARTRDAGRPTYKHFLSWLERQPTWAVPEFPWGANGSVERHAQQAEFLSRAFASSPEFGHRYHETLGKYARRQSAKRRFNGDVVAQVTGESGKALGERMRNIRQSFESADALVDFFSSASEVEALARINAAIGAPSKRPGF